MGTPDAVTIFVAWRCLFVGICRERCNYPMLIGLRRPVSRKRTRHLERISD
jgi:hypothetical protein